MNPVPSAWAIAEALKDYQEKTYAGVQTQITQATGFEVPVEVQWDKIAKPGDGEHYNDPDYFTNVFFTPLVAALKKETSDEMGKEAVKSKLKKIVVTYDTNTAPASNYPEGVKFEDGVLTLNWTPYTNAADADARTKAIESTLEAKL